MAGYRVDQRTRCSKCSIVVAPEDLFHTIEGDALCAACKLSWAEAQDREARSGGVDRYRPRPGFRLVCPRCDLASMEVRENDFLRVARCIRCSKEVSQLRGGVFLAVSLAMMGAVVLDVAWRARFLVLGTVVAGVLALVVRDQLQRKRHRVATLDEIEQADAVLKGERQRVAADALRVAEPEGEAIREAEAEAAEADAQREARGSSR